MNDAKTIKWLRNGLKDLGRGSQVALAKHLGLPESRVSEMIRNKRKISAKEINLISSFLSSNPPSSGLEHAVGNISSVVLVGRIGSNQWFDETIEQSPIGNIGAIIDDRYPINLQTGYVIDANYSLVDLERGDYVICVPFTIAQHGNLIVLKNRKADMTSLSLGLAKRQPSGVVKIFSAHNNSHDESAIGEPFAIVIASQRPRI